MNIRFDRIGRAQALMREHGLLGIMVMNHDDFRYFFGEDRAQPRAIIPFEGPPAFIAFAAEEPELREATGGAPARIFTHVGEQIQDVIMVFRELMLARGGPPPGAKPRVGMQMWFETPAFLVDLFRRVNPVLELVSSDPVMDALRMVKEPEELALMTRAQSIAASGMGRVKELLAPGAVPHDVATEALYAMMRAGAERTSTPIHVNVGTDTCWLHGRVSGRPIRPGDLVVVDLTPQFEGYCANLARTFVIGRPDERQQQLLDTYREMREITREMLVPGRKVAELDARGREVCASHGLAESHVDGISHGIGLRFEETPASTIIKSHRNVPLQAGMTVTIGHTILALAGFGGVRHEDVYEVTDEGGRILVPYPVDPVVQA
jgi:Xaa-Pro aminopeptidase